MIIRSLASQKPFITADGSEIRSILDRSNAPVLHQSLAEARLSAGASTTRHYHRMAEEFYYVLEGQGWMEVGGETALIGPGDAVLIPPGAWHELKAWEPLRFLCCCSPPYSHEDTFFE